MDLDLELETNRGYHLGEDSSNDEDEANYIPADVRASATYTPNAPPFTPASSPPIPESNPTVSPQSEPSLSALQDIPVARLAPHSARSTGHISPGHPVGRPIHESPRANRVEIVPNDHIESEQAIPAPFLDVSLR